MKDLSNKNVIHIIKDGVQYLQFKKLLEYDNIITHCYSLGTDLNFRTAKADKQKLSEKEFEKSLESYKKLCNSLNEDYINIVKTNQNHTDNIKIVNKKFNNEFMDINLEEYNDTDGFITNKKNLILSTTNADCILMLFFDPITKTIANIHSGWKGTLQRISVKTIEKMQKEFGCNPQNIICCICPSIIDIIEKQKDKEKWNIDTVLINRIILKKNGLKDENIIDSGICSVCNSDLIHSYRVEKQGYGLSTALIEIK